MKPTITIITSLFIIASCLLAFFLKIEYITLLIFPLVVFVIDIGVMDDSNTNHYSGMVFLFRMKRVKTDHGRFFVILKDNGYVVLYKDRFFYLEYIDYTTFFTVEKMKDWVKAEYETLYKKELAADAKRRETTNKVKQIKSWNGYIDIQGQRDAKLKDIGV